MRTSVKVCLSVVASFAILAATRASSASPTQSACETNTISTTASEAGVIGGAVGSCGNTQYFTSPDASYGSTGCTNAWIVQVDASSGQGNVYVGPDSSHFPTDQTTCEATYVWIATFDGQGDVVQTAVSDVQCVWVSNPPFAPGCECTIPTPTQNGIYTPATSTSRVVGAVKQNGSFVPLTVSVYAPTC